MSARTMTADAKLRLNELNAKKDDWYRTCKKCGKQITGTMQDVLKACPCDQSP